MTFGPSVAVWDRQRKLSSLILLVVERLQFHAVEKRVPARRAAHHSLSVLLSAKALAWEEASAKEEPPLPHSVPRYPRITALVQKSARLVVA